MLRNGITTMGTGWDGDMEGLLDGNGPSDDDRYLVEITKKIQKLRTMELKDGPPRFIRRRLSVRSDDNITA